MTRTKETEAKLVLSKLYVSTFAVDPVVAREYLKNVKLGNVAANDELPKRGRRGRK
jgi:hypothetical protein